MKVLTFVLSAFLYAMLLSGCGIFSSIYTPVSDVSAKTARLPYPVVTLWGENGVECSMSMNLEPGQTGDYVLHKFEGVCGSDMAKEIRFVNLPSAATILLTDSDGSDNYYHSCVKAQGGDFWFELKTTKKNATMKDALEIDNLQSVANGTIIVPGFLMVDKYIKTGTTMMYRLSCIRVSLSNVAP